MEAPLHGTSLESQTGETATAPGSVEEQRARGRRTLGSVLGLGGFSPGQLDAIESALGRRDVLAVRPTDAGELPGHQIPALRVPGAAVVVLPLTTRGRDDAVDEARPALVTTTPEQLSDPEFAAELCRLHVALVVLDEAHCISQWSHDFRPAYLGLRAAIEALGRPPVVALAAPATARTRADIVASLGLHDPLVVAVETYRPNLFCEVRQVSTEADKLSVLAPLVEEAGGPVIIYTSTIRTAELVWRRLRALGADVALYHGRLSPRARQREQARFAAGDVGVMVATNAIGLATDKTDVRMVVHVNMPGSLDAYYQESSRAGRDGERSRSVLLYTASDQRTHQFFMRRRYSPPAAVLSVARALQGAVVPLPLAELAHRANVSPRRAETILAALGAAGAVRRLRGRCALPAAHDLVSRAEALIDTYAALQAADRSKLDQMIAYCQTAMCRWAKLLEYFDGTSSIARCGHCDRCAARL